MKNWITKNKLLLSIIWMPLVVFIFLDKTSNYNYIFLYIFLFGISLILPDSKVLIPFKIIIVLPFAILYFIKPIMDVFMLFFISIIFPLMVSALIIHKIPEYLLEIDLKSSTKIYLTLTVGIIIISLFSRKMIIFFNSIFNDSYSDDKKKATVDLANLVLSQEKIRYIIYLFFFIYFLIYSSLKLNGKVMFDIKDADLAVFYSFSTYIAFERIINNKSLFIFKPIEFLKKYVEIINSRYSPLENNNPKDPD